MVSGWRYSGRLASGKTWNGRPSPRPSGSGVGMVSALCAAAALCSTRSIPTDSALDVLFARRSPTQNRGSVTVAFGSWAVTDVQPAAPCAPVGRCAAQSPGGRRRTLPSWRSDSVESLGPLIAGQASGSVPLLEYTHVIVNWLGSSTGLKNLSRSTRSSVVAWSKPKHSWTVWLPGSVTGYLAAGGPTSAVATSYWAGPAVAAYGPTDSASVSDTGRTVTSSSVSNTTGCCSCAAAVCVRVPAGTVTTPAPEVKVRYVDAGVAGSRVVPSRFKNARKFFSGVRFRR